ncbi:MAG: hypothetical protein AB1641_25455 [Thermodesulfobacteriota bacterium]
MLCLGLAGCAGPVIGPSLPPVGPIERLSEDMTFLPVLDSRLFPDQDQVPDLETGTPVFLSAEEILAVGRDSWRDENLVSRLKTYRGPLPAGPSFKWSDFPMRGLETDLGLGLEIKSLILKKTELNTLLPAHNLVDAAVLPFFAVGVLASNGHFDLAGRWLPSSTMKLAAQVDLVALSLKAGGPIFQKTYLVRLTEPAVREAALYPGFWLSREDGLDLGRRAAPPLIDQIFRWLARDPELTLWPRLAGLAWLSRLLADERVHLPVKTNWLSRLTGDITVPDQPLAEILTMSHPGYPPLGPGDEETHPVAVEAARGRARLFDMAVSILLDAAGRLNRIKMTRPLVPEERVLEIRIMGLLAKWGTHRSAGLTYRIVALDERSDWNRRKAAWTLLSRGLETADNEGFLKTETARRLAFLESRAPQAAEAVAFLLAVKGEAAGLDHALPRRYLFQALSGEDRWAAPLVLEALQAGDFSPEVVRLAGAMALDQAAPLLLSTLDSEIDRSAAGIRLTRPRLPLLPYASPGQSPASGPDQVSMVRALAAFKSRLEVTRALRSLLERWRQGRGVGDELAAEAVRSLAGLEDRGSASLLADTWLYLAGEDGSPRVRKAILSALVTLAGEEEKARLLSRAESLVPTKPEARGPWLELLEFFEQCRYFPAAAFLKSMAGRASLTVDLRGAALAALAGLAAPESEEIIRPLAGSPEPDLALAARSAWEKLVRERAFWKELERI